ncbi:hypothetical protein MTR_1g064110 [Medicago truncatula]|uniref:Uncharacterized protein n=1 Tax=Medicago truncatula TaxID=3880 RepID=G7IBI4_MEDTR|nr:hypothetical protein MTR_1g064110 [Medicago truncatula]
MAIGPRPYGHPQKIPTMGRGMGKGTKVVAHEGTGIFCKGGYGNGYYSTLPIEYPLPSLD